MDGIYQLTFFLALALLTIVIMIFVFAISLLGRAMEAAVKAERDKLSEKKQNNLEEIEGMQSDIDKAKKSGEIPTELLERINGLNKKNALIDKELSIIRKAPGALTVRGGVFKPGSYLVGALVLTGAAWYSSNVQNLSQIVPIVFWILALVAIGYSIWLMCKSLRIIQDVAITSEEAWIMKTVEAFKVAEKEIEQERRCSLEFRCEDIDFPLKTKVDSELILKPTLRISKGLSAEEISLHIGLPTSFEFKDASNTYILHSYLDDRDYNFARYDVGTLTFPFIFTCGEVKIKTPLTADTYKMVYAMAGKGMSPSMEELEIIVE